VLGVGSLGWSVGCVTRGIGSGSPSSEHAVAATATSASDPNSSRDVSFPLT
jgi:hypothetical protein